MHPSTACATGLSIPSAPQSLAYAAALSIELQTESFLKLRRGGGGGGSIRGQCIIGMDVS
jgi:hypothetical protein